MDKVLVPKVALINSNDDILEALSLYLTEAGFITIKGHVHEFKTGQKDIVEFFNRHQPDAALYDVAPPYEENWNYFNLIKSLKEASGCPFILTTTNKDILERFAGPTNTIEIVGKPFDLQVVVSTIKKAVESQQKK
jgi:DNA-binding response OmpR family regulator